MKAASSLAGRIIGYLIVAQILGFAITAIASIAAGIAGVAAFEGYSRSVDELASARTIQLVIASLVRDDGGFVRIEPVAELRAENARNPALRVAAFDTVRSQTLAGSSRELISTLAGVIQISPTHTHFILPGDPPTYPLGLVEPRHTPYGRLHIAVYRPKFQWNDIYFAVGEDLEGSAALLAATILISAGAAWYAVRQGLHPVRAVAGEAARIDMNSLHQPLPLTGVPAEIAPLVQAMNEALERLSASAARMRRYTANAAHELRTPLAIMRARLEDAEEPTFKSDLMRDASQLQAIVEQLLIASRLSEHQTAIDQDIDLAETVRQIVSDYLPLAIECDRKIEFESDEGAIVARGNRRAIECVVANLIDNGLRAEPVGGTLLVCVRDDGVVEVVDHGDGVSIADREMIFEPFWRKSETTPGTGLGLAIARELMEKLQGRVCVDETPGGGATFRLQLPISRQSV